MTMFHVRAAALLASLTLVFVGCQPESSGGSDDVIMIPDGEGGEAAGAGGAMAMGGGAMGEAGGEMADGLGGAPEMGMGGGDEVPPPDGPACEGSDFSAAIQWAQVAPEGFIQYTALSVAGPVTDILVVEFRTDRGLDFQPGVYDLAEVGGRADECLVCLFSLENRDLAQRRHDRVYMAYTGRVEVVDIGGVNLPVVVNMDGVEMSEVTVASAGGDMLDIELTANGRTYCLDGFEIDTVVKPPPAQVGETVHAFSVQNCLTEEFVNVTEKASNTDALWIVATAEWCPACRQHLPQVMSTVAMNQRENLDVMFVVGENNQRGPITLNACRRYARELGAANAADFYIDHDGLRAFAQLFGYLNPYLTDMGGFGLPWNAVLDGGDPPTYRHADGSGTNLNQILNSLLN